MIIQVRGTSGSGKTTVVRKVKEELGKWKPFFREGRKKPLGYRRGGIVILGHYEIDCGGCDTIGSAPKVFEELQKLDFDIAITEGLLWSEDVKWTLQLKDPRALFLSTDPEECLRRVTIRQGDKTPKDPARVRRKLMTRVGTIDRARARLVEAGVYAKPVSLEQAVRRILKWLKKS